MTRLYMKCDEEEIISDHEDDEAALVYLVTDIMGTLAAESLLCPPGKESMVLKMMQMEALYANEHYEAVIEMAVTYPWQLEKKSWEVRTIH